MSNLILQFQQKLLANSNKAAFILLEDGNEESHQITFGELDLKARAIAAYLQEQQLTTQTVLLAYPQGIEFVCAFLGCLYAGLIAVPISNIKPDSIEKAIPFVNSIIDNAKISAILTNTQLINKIHENFSEHTKNILISDTTILDNEASLVYAVPSIKKESVVYLQYTSGSTSTPKAAMISYQGLIHNIIQSIKKWKYKKSSVALTWAPHGHVYGLICGLLVPLYRGSTTILIPAEKIIRRPITWLNAITHYKVTHSGAPNFAYELCIDGITDDEVHTLRLHSWKVAVNGGELVKHDTLQNFIEKFKKCGFSPLAFCVAYGMSEFSGTISATAFMKKLKLIKISTKHLNNNQVALATSEYVPHRTLSSHGKLINKSKIKIVDPLTLSAVKKDKIGEIWLSGKSVALGYWQLDNETNETFNAKMLNSKNSYLRTGDLGFIKNNELFITGRLKDVVIVYGKKYYLTDLETSVVDKLTKFPIKGRAVITTWIKNKEEIIFLQEINSTMTDVMMNELIKIIRQTISEIHGIDLYGVILIHADSLPKTGSGKLQRRLCQQQYEESNLKIIKPHFKNIYEDEKQSYSLSEKNMDLKEVIKKEIISHISTILKVNKMEIDGSKPISIYGFDSIKIVQLIEKLNQQYDLSITPARLFEFSTINDFMETLYKENEHKFTKHTGVDLPATDNYPLIPSHQKNPSRLADHHSHDIAIIGMSGIFPDAANLDIFWDNLVKGKDAIKEIPKDRWSWEDYYGDNQLNSHKTKIKWGGFIENVSQFDANFFNISPREAELIDPQQRLFLQTAWKAIEDAGYSIKDLKNIPTGLFVGVFNNDYAELLHKNNITDAYITTGVTHSILANRISYLLDLHGPSEAIDTACSSSLVAIHNAILAIHNGDCEIAIAGGVNLLLTPTAYLDANKAGMLSEDGRCKTFDKKANGYVRAEGVAAILLKPLHKALIDGDHIHGVIKGSAVNHGGHANSLTAPNPNAQAEVIASAFRRSHITVDSVNYIETHGTGTALGDPIEINGLHKAFQLLYQEQNLKGRDHYCGLGAVKTNIGHLEAAAGMAGVIKIILAMKHQLIPGNIHYEEKNPYLSFENSPFYLVKETEYWQRIKNSNGIDMPFRAGVSSFGFGGTNAHVILEEAPALAAPTSMSDSLPSLIAISAKTNVALHQHLKNLYTWLIKQNVTPTLSAMSYTLNVGRNHFEKRCIFLVESMEEFISMLELLNAGQHPENVILNLNTTKSNNVQAVFVGTYDLLCSEVLNKNLEKSAYKTRLLALGNLYTEGFDIDWDKLHRGERKRLSLPTYPFDTTRYWIPEQHREHNKSNDNPISKNSESTFNTKDETLTLIQNDLISAVSSLLKITKDKILLSASLSEMGFDSISFKELAVHLEKIYDITLNPTIFFTYTTLIELSHYFLDAHAERVESKFKISLAHSALDTNQEINHITFSKFTDYHNEPIAIIGMQAYLPKANDLTVFWENLLAGHDAITEIPKERWEWQAYYGDSKLNPDKSNSKWCGTINDFDQFDAGFFNISAREANLMDPQQRLFLEIAWKTIEDAGYDPTSFSGKKVGVFAGVEFNEYQALIQKTKATFHGHLATGTSHALIANRVSYFLNLHGPSEVIDTACSSALVAIHHAVNAIRLGECTLALAGGVSLMLDPDTMTITSQLGALSASGRCKTFDKSANGYVKGEGVGAVLLKPLSAAEKDGDTIYGIIKSSAVNHGGKAQSLTAPNAVQQSQLLIRAYEQASVDPQTISYIETHGTGTELGDPIEIEGLKKAFNTLDQASTKSAYCGLGSVKTHIGHLEPASGIASVIKVLLSMKHQKLIGNLHFNEINPLINLDNSPFYIVNQTRDWNRLYKEGKEIPLRAGVSSFGFGGTYAHLVLEEKKQKPNDILCKPYYLVTLSAKQKVSLKNKIADLYHWVERDKNINLEELSYTLNIGRTHFSYRCAIVVKSISDLLSALNSLIHDEIPNNCYIHNGHHSIANDINELALYDNIQNYQQENPEEYKRHMEVLSYWYVNNKSIDWQMLHKGESQRRMASLPTYPYLKQRFWFDQELENQQAESSSQPSINQPYTPSEELYGFTVNYLKNTFANKLKIAADSILADETYEVYGVDSLIGLEITNQLETDLGSLPKTILYEKNRICDLANYLIKKDLMKRSVEKIPYITSSPAESTQVPQAEKTQSNYAPIAIVGISATFPEASNINEFWDNLIQGRDCITDLPKERWNYEDYPADVGGTRKYFKKGGFIPDIDMFDPLFFGISPREAALMDPQERLFMQSVWSTLEDGGYTRERVRQIANNNVGVFAGVTYNFYPLFIAEEWAKGNRLPLDIQTFSIANRVSYFMNFSGPSFVVDTACSSSLAAIHLACESLLQGECKMAVAGGVNLSLHPSKYHFLGGYGFLSEEGRCASFADGGTGYVPGEGVGSVLLKPLADALRDNDRIYGVIKGSSMNHGGKTSGYTVPNPNAQAELIKTALSRANINPRSISYIEAHGTGTPLGDPIEIRGLQEAFEEYTTDKQFCAIGSVKSNIGHLESAAGISQLIKVLLQFKHKKIVPSLHASQLNPFIEFTETPFFVQKELVEWKVANNDVRRAGVSSFGAGGTNVHVILEEYNSSVINQTISQPFIFLLSAMNADILLNYAKHAEAFLEKEENNYKNENDKKNWLANICYTLQVGRESMPARLAILAKNENDLKAQLHDFIKTSSSNSTSVWFTPTVAIRPIDNEKVNTHIREHQYTDLINLWINGGHVAWENLYKSQYCQKIYFPTYPFAKRRCWVGEKSVITNEKIIQDNFISPSNLSEWFYHLSWNNKELSTKAIPRSIAKNWIIFSDKELGLLLQDELGENNYSYIFSGKDYEEVNNAFYINPTCYEHYEKVFTHLYDKLKGSLEGIIYLWSNEGPYQQINSKLIYLFKALPKFSWANQVNFTFITRGSQAVNQYDVVDVWQYYLWSLVRIFGAEQGAYKILLLDLDNNKQLRNEAVKIANEIYQYNSDENHIAYREDKRHIIQLSTEADVRIDKNNGIPAAAIITGGLGALGAEVAKWLVAQGTQYLLLTGTQKLPEKSMWDKVQDSTTLEKINILRSLEKSHLKVRYEAVDVTDKAMMKKIIMQAEEAWNKPITGVFHLSGLTTDSIPIDKMTDDILHKILSVKIQGALVLHEIFNKPTLDCFMLFSSIAALPFFGMSGLSAYAMANEFLDGLALYRQSQGLAAQSINWAAWSEKGMSHRYDHGKFLEAVGMSTISIKQGLEILGQLLQMPQKNTIIFRVQWDKFFKANAKTKRLSLFEKFAIPYQSSANPITTKRFNVEEIKQIVNETMANLLQLAVTEINVEESYANYGLDSIIGINWVSALNEHFPDVISPMDLYRYPNIKSLVSYIDQSINPVDAPSDSREEMIYEENQLQAILHLNEEEIERLIEAELSDIEGLTDKEI
jgi:acyl transferase domain-containing protein/acyl-CoA synthetase (AMP-forming)/AMP-acid ligase II/aryl carrier-like protein/NAD(P)-dependent dehydrogenase (short-subunit alcohol dehydrogenase family)